MTITFSTPCTYPWNCCGISFPRKMARRNGIEAVREVRVVNLSKTDGWLCANDDYAREKESRVGAKRKKDRRGLARCLPVLIARFNPALGRKIIILLHTSFLPGIMSTGLCVPPAVTRNHRGEPRCSRRALLRRRVPFEIDALFCSPLITRARARAIDEFHPVCSSKGGSAAAAAPCTRRWKMSKSMVVSYWVSRLWCH